MIQPKNPLAQSIIKNCQSHNLKHIIISPGSRNAPLTIGFTENDFFKCYSIVDERSAGFFALGIAQQSQQSVALVCTSGSALVNYYPAVVEAFYSRIPLVVISADRPDHLINIGDGQTINQPHIFASHILYEANLKEVTKNSFIKSFKDNDSIITKALEVSNTAKGPVHINAPLSDPLYETVEVQKEDFDGNLSYVINPSISLPKSIIKKWYSSKKKMILVGVNAPESIKQSYLDIIGQDP